MPNQESITNQKIASINDDDVFTGSIGAQTHSDQGEANDEGNNDE